MDLSPIFISLKTAAMAMLIVFAAGVLLAWLIYRSRCAALKIFVDGVFTLPLVLPPTVTGFFLLVIFGSNRPIGSLLKNAFDIQITFTWLATVLAASVIAFPLMYRSARAAMEQVDVELLQAGRTLGMSEFAILRKILLPNALPGLVSGGVLAYARALGEFGATAMIAGNIAGVTRTLPLAVYSSVAGDDMDSAAVYVAVSVCICLIMVILMNWYLYFNKKRQEG